MKVALSIVVVVLVFARVGLVFAQDEEELRQQLEAQKALNEQLRKRVEELERELQGAPPTPALQSVENQLGVAEPESEEGRTAIEEALGAKGLVLLSKGEFRLTPELVWIHSGSNVIGTDSDIYRAVLTLQAGLPQGMMVSAAVPYVSRDTSAGSNNGFGDMSLSLSKTLTRESERLPSFVATLAYLHDNGEDPFESVPIGFGFRVLTGTVSAVKSMEPVVLYGSVSYSHPDSKSVSADNLFGEPSFSGKLAPGDTWAYRLGASLAATPDLTLEASLSGSSSQGMVVDSDTAGRFTLANTTLAFFNLGTALTLAKNLSLLVSASAGATKDSPDFILSASLPYRF